MQHLQPNTTLQGGKYRIDKVLGQGGFGNTYLGYNTEFKERIAIKEFFLKGVTERNVTTSGISICSSDEDTQRTFQEQKEKFRKEALRIRKLKNDHIVRVYDLFEENGTVYYTMDYIDGENLSEKLKRTGVPLSEREVWVVIPQILDALDTAHAEGLLHLDIKPGNIMIDKAGNVTLIDFGASKQMDEKRGGAVAGTKMARTDRYALPEQVNEQYSKMGPWTDFYSLGATIYMLLTRKTPPTSTDIYEDESADKHNAFPLPAEISTEMRDYIIWLMNPDRAQRPQSVSEMLSDGEETEYDEGGSEETEMSINSTFYSNTNSKANIEEKKNTRQPKPDSHIVKSIICSVLCIPFGVAAIVYSAKVDSLYYDKDYVGAEEASKNAMKWVKISLCVWCAWTVLVIIVCIIGAVIEK